ncbi:MAG: response regulator [Thaumarchaeota archaeon]|nr:response regulator [Nitrososphaerota archaeon]
MNCNMTATSKILLVDDDSDFLESLQLVMFEEGYTAYTVSNGYDAIAQYKKLRPDVVFLDVRMPEIDGYDTFMSIIKYDPNAKVVFMSGYTLDVVRYADVEKYAVGTISKPIRHGELKKSIKKIMGNGAK